MLLKITKFYSLWKDLPLQLNNGYVNIVIQIQKNRMPKLEMDKRDPNHSIKQCFRKNKIDGTLMPRYYAKFPAFNYGFIPQTW